MNSMNQDLRSDHVIPDFVLYWTVLQWGSDIYIYIYIFIWAVSKYYFIYCYISKHHLIYLVHSKFIFIYNLMCYCNIQEGLSPEALFEVKVRKQMSAVFHLILLVLNSSGVTQPATTWYAQRVFEAVEKGVKLQVTNLLAFLLMLLSLLRKELCVCVCVCE